VARVPGFLMVLFLIMGPVLAQETRVDLGISVSDGELRGFYLAVGQYYGVPEPQVVATRERYGLKAEDLPVVYFLAARARVEPSVIIHKHRGGMSWLDLTFSFGLTPDIFYVPMRTWPTGPPYGNAYGYYKKHRPGKEWKKIVLTDPEVVDLVNLRFISEYHRLSPEAVVEMRGRGKNFVAINENIRKEKGKAQGKHGGDKSNQKQKGKSKHKN
jgi:hypothetical protein